MSKVVVGIDFGTSGSGYAFSYNNENDIILGKFSEQGVDAKVPTEIILDSKLEKVLAFGHKCKKYIEDNECKKGELYFKNIKMNIYNQKNTIRPYNCSIDYQLIEIIAKILEYIKEEAYSHIQEGHPEITLNQIKWVLTVPAIWDYSQKGIMIKASEKAGLFNDNTERLNFLALEPEVASLYCSKDDTIDLDLISYGKSYIVCDFGGGTGDIATHQKNFEGEIIEKYQPIGGNYGSEEIDKQFYHEVIAKIFGFESFEDLRKKNEEIESPWDKEVLLTEWLNLLSDIQSKKKIDEDSKGKTFFLNCQLFEDFTNGDDLSNLVNNYNDSCREGWKVEVKTKNKWWIKLPYKIFFDLINEQALKIIELLVDIYNNVEDIDSIIYVGGYSANKILLNKIKKEFRDIQHLVPARPGIAVTKGAVLFGLNPKVIKSRKAPYSIGFNCDHFWDDNIHYGIGEKYYDNEYKCYKCRYTFDKFIEIGEDIRIGHKITRSYVSTNSSSINLKFFKTEKKNPMLWTEDGVELLGEDNLYLGRDYSINERGFIITMEFGGTFVEAKCLHQLSNKTLSVKLYFNKNNI